MELRIAEFSLIAQFILNDVTQDPLRSSDFEPDLNSVIGRFALPLSFSRSQQQFFRPKAPNN